MPKKQLRIALTPSKELYEALQQFSEVSGLAMSSFCKQMLEENIPVIRAMTKAYQVAYERPQEGVSIMLDELSRVSAEASQTVLDLGESKKVVKLRKSPKK